ncbi:alpha/beta fold hydrolase [Sphingomonas sp.]|uniref:alpha/beta fold hydrolase n=1 Tax=Sphingomonas sp. TaxID=28214 RepID=UPI002EDB92FC
MFARIRSHLLVAVAALATPVAAQAQTAAPPATSQLAPARSGTVEIDGIAYYYEVRGQGEPLLLLHGGLGSIDMFAPILPALAAGRQVIAVDLQGHGRTPLGNRPIGLEAMGKVMDALLGKLGFRQVDVLGYSMGAGVGFQLAAQHPERVRRLALVSMTHATSGIQPEMVPIQRQLTAAMAPMMKDTPMYTGYVARAPRPQDFPKLLDQMGDLMRRDYDWSAQVKALTMPVMLVVGDADMWRPEASVEFFKLLGGGQRDGGWQREHVTKHRLAILPGRTHYDMFLAPELVPTVRPFLDGKEARADWK